VTGSVDRSYPGLAQFEPRLDILPVEQRALWPRLGRLPASTVERIPVVGAYGSTVSPFIRDDGPAS
jgi:hypothetical protein